MSLAGTGRLGEGRLLRRDRRRGGHTRRTADGQDGQHNQVGCHTPASTLKTNPARFSFFSSYCERTEFSLSSVGNGLRADQSGIVCVDLPHEVIHGLLAFAVSIAAAHCSEFLFAGV